MTGGLAGRGVLGGRAAGGAARRGGRGLADCRGARARGVRGNLSGQTRRPPCGRSPEQCDASATHCPYPGMCGRKGPVRERGDGGGTPGSSAVFGRDRRAVPEPPRRLYPGSEVAPRLALGRWSEGVPPSRAANRPAIPRAGRRYPRRRRRRGRGGMPERRGDTGGNTPLSLYPCRERGEPSRPSPPAIRGRGRRRLAGGPSHLRPLSCGRGPAGWKGPVRRIRRLSRPRTAGPAGAAPPATGLPPGQTEPDTPVVPALRHPPYPHGGCRHRGAVPARYPAGVRPGRFG
jgi:hypothetical protein